MAQTTLAYRLQIMAAATLGNPNPSTVALTYESIPSGSGGVNPYLAGPPSGDGQEIDVLTGSSRAGAYTVEIVDVATGTDATGTVRAFTSQLEDAGYRQQLVGRRAVLSISKNGGAFSQLISGYITGIRLVSPMRYAIGIGDTRRVEQSQPIFNDATMASFMTLLGAVRATFTGGPLTGTWGVSRSRGGWRYTLDNSGGPEVLANFVSGYAPNLESPVVTDWRTLVRDDVVNRVSQMGQRFAPTPIGVVGMGTIYTDLVAYVGTDATNAVLRPDIYVATYNEYAIGPYGPLRLYWPTPPGPGTEVFISLTQRTVSDLAPLYIDAHPVDIVLAIWATNAIAYDTGAAWITTIRNLIGPDVRLALRLTEVPIIAEFLQNAIFGPFGITARTNADGNQQLVPSRILTTALPTLTISANEMRGADEVVFDIDERSAVSSVSLTQTIMTPARQGQSGEQAIPVDGIYANPVTGTARNVTLSLIAARDIAFTVPGMIHNAASFEPTFALTLTDLAESTLARFGRGVQAADVAVMDGTAAAAAQVGDEVYFTAPHFPNRGYRIGESTVGARIMQVVRRTETPSGPVLRLLDSGINAQPVTPAAAITVAQSPASAALVARYTITNASAINSTGVLSVRVEWAVGASTPTANGQDHAVYSPGQVPTTGVDLPALSSSGARVWVRARTEQVERRPSAWSAWADVTLAAIPTPGTLTASVVSATAADISWTNTSNDYPIAVFAYRGTTAPADWTPYRLATMPPRSTSSTVRALSSGTWQLAIAYDSATTLGPLRTTSITAAGVGAAAARPAGLAAIDTLDDVTQRQGIALGLFPSDQTLDYVLERSLNVATGYVAVARINGAEEVVTDLLPRDGTTYYYRLRHALGGFDTSAATPAVSAVARGVPPTVNRPPARVPTVQVGVSETSTTGTVSLTISDTQGRFVQARFRHRTNGGAWSAWTVATATPTTNPSGTINGYTASYAASLPATGFLDIEYEVTAFGADGVVAVIAGGVESFDVGVSADFVSVVGTFGINGDFVLALSADTDTQSFKLAFSTTAQPNLATTQAQGAINGRNYTTTFSGPYDVGTIIYVSALGYTGAGGTGTESVLFEYQFQRGASNIQCLATETTSTNTQSTVSVAALSATGAPISGAQVQLVALDGPTAGKATIASGAAIGAWVTAPGTWVFNRGTPLSGSSEATFRARRSASLTNETDDDGFIIVEEGRDTKPVRSRARIITTTATQCVVRVAVNVPSPYTATTASITYVPQGVGTVSPGSGQAVTTGVGDFATPETAGSFVDFTVDRPAVGQPAGGVTFTATATGFAPDTDPIAIPPQSTTLALLGRARVLTTTATTVVVRVAVTSPVALSPNTATIVYSEAGVTGTSPASGQTVTPTTGDFITEAGGAPLNYVDFTINRPAFAAGTGRVVFTATATDRAAVVAPIDVPAVERDTVPLLARARVTATSATSMTVRVAVASPVALSPNTASIAYVEAGVTGTSPASPRTVTPQTGDTITEAAGSFEDFTITRPAFGAGAGRATFQVTATGRVAAVDAIDVPPQDKDFTPPTFSPTLTLASTTGQVSWPAVAVGVTVEGSTDNVTFTTATGTTYPTAATGRNAFGGATKFLFVRAYNAAGVYTPTYSFAVPPQDPAVPVITKVTAYTLTLNYSTDPTDPNTFQLDYTISNFPSGGSIEVSVLQDGVDIGIPVISSSSSTQTIVASPIVLNATGTTPVRWDIMFRVMDSTGINVEATSKVLDATSYI